MAKAKKRKKSAKRRVVKRGRGVHSWAEMSQKQKSAYVARAKKSLKGLQRWAKKYAPEELA
jgi:hypothetical protein